MQTWISAYLPSFRVTVFHTPNTIENEVKRDMMGYNSLAILCKFSVVIHVENFRSEVKVTLWVNG